MKLGRIAIIALAVGSLLAFSNVASAQDSSKGQGKRGMTVEQQMERLTTQLSLTDAQKPKVKAVLEDSQKKRQELRDVPQDQRREKMQALMEEQNKKMKEILTPEQQEKYKKYQEEMRKGGQRKKTE